jgi:hypothetical protein
MEASVTLADTALVEDIDLQRDRLLWRLAEQRARNGELWGWYRGQQDLPDVPAGYAAAYQLFLDHAITPWARLVVDSVAERLRVQGVRSADNTEAASEVWDAFQRARLTADQRLIYTEALIGGTGYVSVADTGGGPRIVPESSFEVTHEPDLTDRQRVAAALKIYPLDWSRRQWVTELYRPEATYRWLAEVPRPPRDIGAMPIDSRRRGRFMEWSDGPEVTSNPLGAVPVVPFENRVNVLAGGASEIEDCIPILQRIDRLTLDLMLTSHYGSFRQKWATGLQVPRDPDTGKPIEPYKSAVTRLWVNEKADGSFGSFDATDPSGYLTAIDSQIATLAAISRVPAHYLMQRNLANPPSAESLIAAETGLVSKVEDRQNQYGEAWEQAFWLWSQLSGIAVDVEEFEVEWVDAEKRNPAQVADAATKWAALGVPEPALWEYGGFSPQQISEWTTEQAASDLLAAASTAPAPVPVPASAPPPPPPAAPPEAPVVAA